MKKVYNHKLIESKWQTTWNEKKTYEPSIAEPQKPFYNLMMFPYPSAEGLHVGNMYAFTGTDVYGRFKRMSGNDVFEPIGLDGFGIHSENYAIKVGRHPKEHASISEDNFYRQLGSIGNGYAWNYRLETYDPNYYQWTQWLFIKMFEAGLAYRGTAKVNWCPKDKTVLADEQVVQAKNVGATRHDVETDDTSTAEMVCERCGTPVERREMSSWYFGITKYADKLLDGLKDINWPKKITQAQEQWIGKKEGITISYKVSGLSEQIDCFTTRPETNFGATFIVLAPEHEFVKKILQKKIVVPTSTYSEIDRYVSESLKKTEQDRLIEGKKKTGVFTSFYIENPLNNKKLPVWIGDFVLSGFGTGAVVGVPGHDLRDFEFAQAHDIAIERVISVNGDMSEIVSSEQLQEDEGVMVNSSFLDGLTPQEAYKKMIEHSVKEGWAKKVSHYHLRDWLISRQRYWGPPIPMIFCETCHKDGKGSRKDMPGWFTAPISTLPIELPNIDDFQPKGDGTSPLSNADESFKYTKCPSCGERAKRELDVSDTFLDSSWYFLAYPHMHTDAFKKFISLNDNHSKDESATPFDKKIVKTWFPVDAYIGGAEHAVLHLLYARFVWKVFCDLDLIDSKIGYEPFPFLYGHGLIIKDGAKMSKSKGNVVNPDEYIEKFGADTLRTYLMFLGPYDQGGDFRDTGIEGMHRFLKRVWEIVDNFEPQVDEDGEKELKRRRHQAIMKVTQDMEKLRYNTAISHLMEFVNYLKELPQADNKSSAAEETKIVKQSLVQLIAPFAPHMAEEMWCEALEQKFSVHQSQWPEYDEKEAQERECVIAVQINGKLRGQVEVALEDISDQEKVENKARADKTVASWIEANEVKKIIYVPGKVLNFVI